MCSSLKVVVLSAVAALWIAAFVGFPMVYEVGQCDRVCNIEFRGSMFPIDKDEQSLPKVYGTRSRNKGGKGEEEKCLCYETPSKFLGEVKRLYTPVEPGYPYIYKNPQVCGVDGKVYETAEAARAQGIKIANCGVCGRCSNPHDVSRFRTLGDGLVKAVSPCIVSYMLFPFTKSVDQYCMESNVGLSKDCAECWVEDHGCLFSHCFYDCVLKLDSWMKAFAPPQSEDGEKAKAWTGRNTPDEANTCLGCMETKCSKPYIDSCGANRRTSGVTSEIDRDSREICPYVDI